MRALAFVIPLAFGPLVLGCDAGSENPPASATGRWIGTASVNIDTTVGSTRYVGFRADSLTLTLADNSGTLTGRQAWSTSSQVTIIIPGGPDDTYSDSDSDDRAVTGVYAPPFIATEVTGVSASYPHRTLDLEVRGDEARSTVLLYVYGFPRSGSLVLRRQS